MIICIYFEDPLEIRQPLTELPESTREAGLHNRGTGARYWY